MFKRVRFAALVAVPALAAVLAGILGCGHPILALVLFPPGLQIPFFLAAAATGSPRAIDAALLATRFTAMLMIGGGIVCALVFASAPLLFVSFVGGCLMLGAGPGSSEVRLAGCLALTGALFLLDAFVLVWAGLWVGFWPGVAMLLGGAVWALEATMSPATDDAQLPRATARFSH